MLGAGAALCVTKDESLERIVEAILAGLAAGARAVNLTRRNTAIVLDSTADFPEAPERFPNWRVVPLYVRFGDESFRDYVDLGPDEFYARLAGAPTRRRPRSPPRATSSPSTRSSPRVRADPLAPASPRRCRAPSRAPRRRPRLGGGAVRVVDTRTVSAAIAMLALAIQRRLERGTTDEEIDALIERFRATTLLFTVDTLEYLASGGRIGRASAFAGSLLNVKPILVSRAARSCR